MPRTDVLSLLEGGDRRSIGRSDRAVAMVSRDPRLFSQLIDGLWSANPLIRMRAADAAEKVTRFRRDLLRPHRKRLLNLLLEAKEQEVRWHLAAMVPRLRLNSSERDIVMSALSGYLADRSSIVRTLALQGLFDLARDAPSLRPKVTRTLRVASQTGTAAMRARSRKLLSQGWMQ